MIRKIDQNKSVASAGKESSGHMCISESKAPMAARYETFNRRRLVHVERCTEHTNHKVRKVGGLFVQLNPADHAVFFEIFADLRFVDSEVFGKPGSERFVRTAPLVAPAAEQMAKRHSQRLAGLDVVRGSKIGFGHEKNARSGRRIISFIERVQWT